MFLLYQSFSNPCFSCAILDIFQPYIKSVKETTWKREITLRLNLSQLANNLTQRVRSRKGREPPLKRTVADQGDPLQSSAA